jgi:multiple RNA-binding domain-containing protein 1
MAPSKTLLLVEFIEPSEARAALKGLAYRNYKHSPLYLEWAPLSNASNGNVVKQKKDNTLTAISAEQETCSSSIAVESLRSTDEDKDNQHSYSTLFVKNINFSTTEDALRSHLESLGVEGLRTVLIQKKMVGSHLLSQGYGFVEFRSAESAARSLVRMNGSLLDSHALEVKPSDKRVSAAPSQAVLSKSVLSGGVNKLNNRVVVRNVAFQSTKAEIRSLFSSFGSVQTVRMPKKMGGEHRGFAFVEFSTAQEAAQAMASLRNTHLYGRHLVLEWAKDDDQDEFQAGGSNTATSGASAFNAVQAPAGVTASGAAIDKLRRRARQDVQAIAAQQKRRKVEDVLDSSHMVTADDI